MPCRTVLPYAASKWGLNGLSYSAAEELRKHVSVSRSFAPVPQQRTSPHSAKTQRMLQPEDIAHAVAMSSPSTAIVLHRSPSPSNFHRRGRPRLPCRNARGEGSPRSKLRRLLNLEALRKTVTVDRNHPLARFLHHSVKRGGLIVKELHIYFHKLPALCDNKAIPLFSAVWSRPSACQFAGIPQAEPSMMSNFCTFRSQGFVRERRLTAVAILALLCGIFSLPAMRKSRTTSTTTIRPLVSRPGVDPDARQRQCTTSDNCLLPVDGWSPPSRSMLQRQHPGTGLQTSFTLPPCTHRLRLRADKFTAAIVAVNS